MEQLPLAGLLEELVNSIGLQLVVRKSDFGRPPTKRTFQHCPWWWKISVQLSAKRPDLRLCTCEQDVHLVHRGAMRLLKAMVRCSQGASLAFQFSYLTLQALYGDVLFLEAIQQCR